MSDKENRDIVGISRSVRDLLNNKKYTIDYYQREYKWGEKRKPGTVPESMKVSGTC
jgi:hypothetical protein